MAIPWGLLETDPALVITIQFCWILWELYCPIPNHQTKLQQYHHDFTTRLKRIEVGQVALAAQVEAVDEDKYKDLHNKDSLSPADLYEDQA